MEGIASDIILAGAVGAVLGAAITYIWAFSERRQAAVPAAATPPLVPPGAESVLSVLSWSAVLVAGDDTVVKASAPAYALGLVHNDTLRPTALMDLVRQVRRDGQIREAEDLVIEPERGPVLHVRARVAPLTSRLILVLVEDRTSAARVEAIRRDFVANVSHELKTPIGALNLLAEAVGEAKDDPAAVTRFAERMHIESDRLTRLVQQIIDLSRLQYDVGSNNATAIKVEELVSEAREHSATDAEAKQIQIAVDLEPDLLVHGDRTQLHAAISNLVENAVTYSPDGSRVAVVGERRGDDIRLTVTDNGIGISAEEVERIFERFYRVDPARARATGGTGLGLSIVKHVAASNGGTVEVWSEPGLGSSFTLVLPAFSIDADEERGLLS